MSAFGWRVRGRRGHDGVRVWARLHGGEVALERRRVVSDQANKLHREASRLSRMPAYRWKCGCGWAHGLSIGYRFISAEQAAAHEGSFCNGGCDLT